MIYNLFKAIKISKKSQLLRTLVLSLSFVVMILCGVACGVIVTNQSEVNATTGTPKKGTATASFNYQYNSDCNIAIRLPGYIYITPIRNNDVVNLADIAAEIRNNQSEVYAESGTRKYSSVYLGEVSHPKAVEGIKQVNATKFATYGNQYTALIKEEDALMYAPQTTESLIFLPKATSEENKDGLRLYKWYLYAFPAKKTDYVVGEGKMYSADKLNTVISSTADLNTYPKTSNTVQSIKSTADTGGIYVKTLMSQMVNYQKTTAEAYYEKNDHYQYNTDRYNYDYAYFKSLKKDKLKSVLKSCVIDAKTNKPKSKEAKKAKLLTSYIFNIDKTAGSGNSATYMTNISTKKMWYELSLFNYYIQKTNKRDDSHQWKTEVFKNDELVKASIDFVKKNTPYDKEQKEFEAILDSLRNADSKRVQSGYSKKENPEKFHNSYEIGILNMGYVDLLLSCYAVALDAEAYTSANAWLELATEYIYGNIATDEDEVETTKYYNAFIYVGLGTINKGTDDEVNNGNEINAFTSSTDFLNLNYNLYNVNPTNTTDRVYQSASKPFSGLEIGSKEKDILISTGLGKKNIQIKTKTDKSLDDFPTYYQNIYTRYRAAIAATSTQVGPLKSDRWFSTSLMKRILKYYYEKETKNGTTNWSKAQKNVKQLDSHAHGGIETIRLMNGTTIKNIAQKNTYRNTSNENGEIGNFGHGLLFGHQFILVPDNPPTPVEIKENSLLGIISKAEADEEEISEDNKKNKKYVKDGSLRYNEDIIYHFPSYEEEIKAKGKSAFAYGKYTKTPYANKEVNATRNTTTKTNYAISRRVSVKKGDIPEDEKTVYFRFQIHYTPNSPDKPLTVAVQKAITENKWKEEFKEEYKVHMKVVKVDKDGNKTTEVNTTGKLNEYFTDYKNYKLTPEEIASMENPNVDKESKTSPYVIPLITRATSKYCKNIEVGPDETKLVMYQIEYTFKQKDNNGAWKEVFTTTSNWAEKRYRRVLEPTTPPYDEIQTTPKAYCELKNNQIYNETFEAMAGVPSTETLYFSTGGSEFIVNMQAEYDPDNKAVRTYKSRYEDVDCEYQHGDQLKGGNRTYDKVETFVANKNDATTIKPNVTAEKANIPDPQGNSSEELTTNAHGSRTEYSVTWTGTIENQTPEPSESPASFDPGKPGSPCPGQGWTAGNGASRKKVNAQTNWSVDKYNTAVSQAVAWAKQMEQISNTANGNLFRIADSDGIKRSYHVGKAVITVTLSGGDKSHSNAVDGVYKNFSLRNKAWTSGDEASMKLKSDEKTVLGSGWSYSNGRNATGGGHVNACGGHFNTCSSTAKGHSHTSHNPGFWNTGVDITFGASDTINYVIKVTFKNGYTKAVNYDGDNSITMSDKLTCGTGLAAHALCGACCMHHLPAIQDKWEQTLKFDTVRITNIKVWKIAAGYVNDMTEIQKGSEESNTITKYQPEYSYADKDGEDSIEYDYETGVYDEDYFNNLMNGTYNDEEFHELQDTDDEYQYVVSNIVQQEPNIFYNVAAMAGHDNENTSKAGRIRYSIQRGQDDNVVWYEYTFTKDESNADVWTQDLGDGYAIYSENPDNRGSDKSEMNRRTPKCDGATGTRNTSDTYGPSGEKGKLGQKSDTYNPAKVPASGHKKKWCRGILFSRTGKNSTGALEEEDRDEYYFNINDVTEDGPYTKKVDKKSSGTYSTNVDSIDIASPEWKRFKARRNQNITATVISDFLILQTSSGDQKYLYHQNKVKTKVQKDYPDSLIYHDCDSHKTEGVYDNGWDKVWNTKTAGITANGGHVGVNIGSYNGWYNSPTTKYKGRANQGGQTGQTVKTAFDDDVLYYCSTILDNPDEYGNLFETSIKKGDGDELGRACTISKKMTRNPYSYEDLKVMIDGTECKASPALRQLRMGYDTYKSNTGVVVSKPNGLILTRGGTYDTTDEIRVGKTSVSPFKNKTVVAGMTCLDRGPIYQCPTNVNKEYKTGQSYCFWEQILEYNTDRDWENKSIDKNDYLHDFEYEITSKENKVLDKWDIDNTNQMTKSYFDGWDIDNRASLHTPHFGYTKKSAYGDGFSKCNDIVVQDPVSVEYAHVITEDKDKDQRIFADDLGEDENIPDIDTSHSVFRCLYPILCNMAKFTMEDEYVSESLLVDLGEDVTPEDIEQMKKDGLITDDDYGTYISSAITNRITKTIHGIGDIKQTGFKIVNHNGSKALYNGGSNGILPITYNSLSINTDNVGNIYRLKADFTVNSSAETALFAKGSNILTTKNGKMILYTSNGEIYESATSPMSVGVAKTVTFDTCMGDASKTYSNVYVNDTLVIMSKTGSWDGGSLYGKGFFVGNTNETSYSTNMYVDNIEIIKMPGTTNHIASCYVDVVTHALTTQDYYNGTNSISAKNKLVPSTETVPVTTTTEKPFSKEFGYNGAMQSVELNPGTYTLEVYGAAGGNPSHGAGGGLGGYSKGTITLTSKTTLYIGVGQSVGPFNGGGYGYSSDGTYGGGATHIATANGQLSSLASNTSAVLIVAGGGGSGGCSGWHGGAGGGANQNGGSGYGGGSYGAGGYGGTLSGSSQNYNTYGVGFGQGGSSGSGYGSGGGGGGYYGGSAGECQGGGGTAGGGGSGYANTSKLTNISGSTGVHAGHGYAKISGTEKITTTTMVTRDTTTISASFDGEIDWAGTNTEARQASTETTTYNSHTHSEKCLSASSVGLKYAYTKALTINTAPKVTGDLSDGQSKTFNYTGNVQQVQLQPGTYKLEAWGASGGGQNPANTALGSRGGQGGYTAGTITLNEAKTLFINVGQAGSYGAGSSPYGGASATYNGGGAGSNAASGSGGGATDFRLNGGNWNDLNSLKSRILVAGGGGGSDNYSNGETTGNGDDGSGGAGGGMTSQGAWISGSYNSSYCATQTAGAAFGIGGTPTTNTDTGGGGGGYYGGRVTNHNNGGAGGGSSYVSGYSGCDTTYRSSQGNVSFTDVTMQQGGHTGNGVAKITCVSTVKVQTGEPKVGDTADLIKMISEPVWNKIKNQVNLTYTPGYCISNPGESEIQDGQSKVFNYTGGTQEITLQPGTYKFEVWGGQGGTSNSGSYVGGKGGYSYGNITINEETKYYINVGGMGTASTATFGGGGYGQCCGGAGGGSTDIRTVGGAWDSQAGLNSRLIVAGGGGGGGEIDNAGNWCVGGYGGGANSGGRTSRNGITNYSTNAWSFGYGQPGAYDDVAGGGGWYGGVEGTGGSGYVSPSLTGETIAGNVSFTAPNGGTEVGHAGAGCAKITAIEIKPPYVEAIMPTTLDELVAILQPYYKEIPITIGSIVNPIWYCSNKYDKHICTSECTTRKELSCKEAHHTGGHYSSDNMMCYQTCFEGEICKDNAYHKDVIEKEMESSSQATQFADTFVLLDNYFETYYPNIGDFAENPSLQGIPITTQTRGKGYTNQMDTTKWTREKWINLPVSVLYYRVSTGVWEEYEAGDWISLDVRIENQATLKRYQDYLNRRKDTTAKSSEPVRQNPKDLQVGDGIYYYQFYTQLRNEEVNFGTVQYSVEAINLLGTPGGPGTVKHVPFTGAATGVIQAMNYPYCNGSTRSGETDTYVGKNTYYKKDWARMQDCDCSYSSITNKIRFNDLTAYHSAYKAKYMDVIGRIGNLIIEDTDDMYFSNLFKKPTTDGWYIDGVIRTVNSALQNTYLSWKRNDGTQAVDVRGEKVSASNQYYNTWTTQVWTDLNRVGASSNIANRQLAVPLSSEKNNINVGDRMRLRNGYNVLWDITSMGNYVKGTLQVKPYFYVVDIKKASKGEANWLIPVDVYMNNYEEAEPVNYFGLYDDRIDASGAVTEEFNKRWDAIKTSNYNLYLNWQDEAKRRNYTDEEQFQTEYVRDYSAIPVYDKNGMQLTQNENTDKEMGVFSHLIVPFSTSYKEGNLQLLYVQSRGRTFVGNSKVTALNDNNLEDWRVHYYGKNGVDANSAVNRPYGINSDTGETKEVFADGTPESGSKTVGKDAIDTELKSDFEVNPGDYYQKAQRWHLTLGTPSSATFVAYRNGVHRVPSETIVDENGRTIYAGEEFLDENGELSDRYVVLMTANIIVQGDIYDLEYNQGVDNGVVSESYTDESGVTYHWTRAFTVDDFNKEVPGVPKTLLAVYGGRATEDLEIMQTH